MPKTPGKNLRQELFLLFQFCYDYLRGMAKFRGHQPYITVYGSANLKKDHPDYQQAKSLGTALAKAGYTVLTGGGPGLMEAANLGAQSIGKSMGCAVEIPTEQEVNDYLDHHIVCNHLFSRKLLLTRYSSGFIALPGGFGTLDELFEMVTLVKTGHMAPFPIILIGKAFWTPLLTYIESVLLPHDVVRKHDMETMVLVDSVDEALAILKEQLEPHDAC